MILNFMPLLVTCIAVVALAEPPTAPDRVKQLEQAQHEISPPAPEDLDAPSVQASVTLRLKTPDGAPPPKSASVEAYISSPRHNSARSLGDLKGPEIKFKIRPGNVELMV